VIADTKTGSIVSSTCLIPQKFSYEEGSVFGAGLPELVGTHPDCRRRGLVGEQFEALHRWSEERGHLMQAIGGIPYYCRRFGYEMAVYMGKGRRSYANDIPAKPSHATEGDSAPRSHTLRPASPNDVRFLADLHQEVSRRLR
jgi:predicted acetyltransferase